MITVTGTLQGITGDQEPGQLRVQLCGYGGQVPRVSGTALLARTTVFDVAVDDEGAFTFPVYANDAITPGGTYYTVAVMDANGDPAQINAYRLLGADHTQDLSTLAPFDPTAVAAQPLIADQLVAVPWSATPAFDGTAGLVFDFPLNGNVTASTFANAVPGNLYIFIITQDATGGHTSTWPATVNGRAAISIDPRANATTVQLLVARADHTLDQASVAMFDSGIAS